MRQFLFLLRQLLDIIICALGIALRQRVGGSLLVLLHLLIERLRLADELVLLTKRRLIPHLSDLLTIVLFTHMNPLSWFRVPVVRAALSFPSPHCCAPPRSVWQLAAEYPQGWAGLA